MSNSRLRTKVTGMISRGNPLTAFLRRQRRAGWTLLLLGMATFAVPAAAQNALESVTSTVAPGGRTEISLNMARPPATPKLFTIGAPPRIALDLPDTRNALTERRVPVGLGAAEAVTAVEAGGRTRVIVELDRMVGYSTRVEGNKLVLSLDSGGMAAAQTAVMAANDPTKSVAVTQASISNLDFRRGSEGEGRVIIGFNSENASANVRRDGNRLLIDLPGTTLGSAVPRQLDVTDFATPVQGISVRATGNGTRVEVMTDAEFEHLGYQTGREYVVEVSAPKVLSPAQRALEEPVYSGERVTFNFQDIPVRSVLQLIADVSNLNIVVADTVQGSVTLRLDNVPWDQALDIVMNAKGLDKRQSGNVIWVAPQAEIVARETQIAEARIRLDDNAPLVSEYLQVNYGKAKDIAELLTSEALQGQQGGSGGGAAGATTSQTSGFLSTRGSVTFDERTNVLLVNDTPAKIAEIRELVARLDRPVDQVLIESRIVIASESFGREIGARFGLSGGYEDRDGNILTTGGTSESTDRMNNLALQNRFAGRTTGLPVASPDPLVGNGVLVPNLAERLNVNLPVANPAGSLALAVLGADYLLDLELSALETEGRGEVVSNPRVITANQREAVIRQGDEVGFVTISPQSGGNDVPIPNVQFKEVLLELKVTPTITQDQRVFLNMNVKKDEVAGFVSTSIGDVPQIQKRELSTAVLVDNGQTVVLGGVYEFSKREDLQKVPFLGDIPGLGVLFRNKNRTSEKAELLIFVTPKILAQSLR